MLIPWTWEEHLILQNGLKKLHLLQHLFQQLHAAALFAVFYWFCCVFAAAWFSNFALRWLWFPPNAPSPRFHSVTASWSGSLLLLMSVSAQLSLAACNSLTAAPCEPDVITTASAQLFCLTTKLLCKQRCTCHIQFRLVCSICVFMQSCPGF